MRGQSLARSFVLVIGAIALGAILIAIFFATSDADDVQGYVAPKPPPRMGGCSVTAWSVRGVKKFALWVGAVDGNEADCQVALRVLCIKPGNASKPPDFTLPAQATWTGAELTLSLKPVVGVDVDDSRCTEQFGSGWRTAKVSDGGPFGLGATGELPAAERFWVGHR